MAPVLIFILFQCSMDKNFVLLSEMPRILIFVFYCFSLAQMRILHFT